MTSSTNSIDFYVWKSPQKGGTGHFGTGYTTPEESRYHAIQPGQSLISLVASTLFGAVLGLPCPSQTVDSLKKDTDFEGVNPDYIVHFPADSSVIQKLNRYFHDRADQSVNGSHLYNLSPNAPWAFNAMRGAVSAYPTPDLQGSSQQALALARGELLPMSEDEQIVSDTLDSITMGHCATEGVNVARIMGLDIEQTELPFDYNPEMLGEVLKRTPGAQIEYPPRPPESWEGFCRYT